MDNQTSITRVMNIGVPVTDQDRALDFYTQKLGFETRRDAPLPQFGGRWIEVAPPGASITLSLVPARDGVPAGVETGIRLATNDADAVHENLRGGGVDVGEVLRWPGVPAMFAFHDPDGNGLEIVQDS